MRNKVNFGMKWKISHISQNYSEYIPKIIFLFKVFWELCYLKCFQNISTHTQKLEERDTMFMIPIDQNKKILTNIYLNFF